MKVLTVYAHHDVNSFCHAILERFSAGLSEAGHTNEVIDLYAIGFDPILRSHDRPNWIDDSVPDDVLANLKVEESLLRSATGPLKRFMVRRWIGGRDARGIVRKLHHMGGPSDIAIQQKKVAEADALAFISPVYFLGFPAILKGWIERVFTLGFAFGLTPDAWRGDIRGRLPLLTHKKALIINTTIFDEQSYEGDLAAAMKISIDDFALRYPGVQSVEHAYFYAVHGADEATRQSYLEKAYSLGMSF
ncbi:MAG: flavodoxin family protein [Mesorhizobium sp.]|uniref:NAD(P)H-dependent oxidoreductase n=1 Tax=Mesorhizobium sp. TaxID=1871066 RepID=UPI000FE822AB|nr:NAD(P)H-dependent oxidoreductase [Mesorhizobium sp.]RWL92928.1 MAG: flavodoxin family protein [Mesorhizobium sp.]